MQTKIKKWGNSLGVRIPQALAASLGVTENMIVDLAIDGEVITIKPCYPKVTLKELVSRITTKNPHTETEWGEPTGR